MAHDVLELSTAFSPDPDELVRAAMQWHFSERTGTPFWLKRARSLDFDPLHDVHGFADLRLFPDVASEWRTTPVEDLIPRGYGDRPDLAGIFESGGTTGKPKRVVCMREWLDYMVAWSNANLAEHAFPRGTNWLGFTPSGPHFVGRLFQESATTYGVRGLTLDVDPRWVKKLIAAGKGAEADAYAEHVVDQAADILKTQDIGVLTITPPLLERVVRREELIELVNRKVRAIRWGGTQLDPETRALYQHSIFPSLKLYGHYGNTMILGVAGERANHDDSDTCVFDTSAPYVTFAVVDPDTREPVPYGERGRVVTTHVSRAMFLPNNLERDLATRIAPRHGRIGDAVANIAPVARFESEAVIEGVY
ncbi:AMP-binding protein [Burkholderia sp. LMG 32019]|uniref:AMP-binding protein n=1 Tax=Burkholderia sp. LMG 32019 TaxID=3158173 RepID=UPI003C2EF781